MLLINKIIRILVGAIIKWKYSMYKRDYSVWVFGEWFGKKCGDNCTYLANYVAKKYRNIKVFWIADGDANLSLLDKSITVLERDSNSARSLLKRAGVGFVGQNFKDLDSSGYNYLGNAYTIMLWHGIPWKYIGHDGNGDKSILLLFYNRLFDYVFGTKYMLSPSIEYDKICVSAFGIKERNIIKAGYPRNSVFYDNIEVERRKKMVLDLLGWNGEDVKIIVYMPTFRETSQTFDITFLAKSKSFMEYIKSENILLIQKDHFISMKKEGTGRFMKGNRFFYLSEIDPQTLLCAADVLVTDYSSCFFDYSILDRPIIHFLYDYEVYKNKERGLYYSKEDVVFGSIAETEHELINEITKNIKNPYLMHQRRALMRKKFLNYENSDSCFKIVNEILNLVYS